MKRKFRFSVSLLCLIVLVSCSSTSIKKPESYTSEQADYALHLALEKAVERATEEFRAKLHTMNFIPSEYSVIEDNKNNITGMQTLINEYNTYMSSFLDSNIYLIANKIKEIGRSHQFSDPKDMVVKSESSVSLEILVNYSDMLEKYIESLLEKADNRFLRACINQFNAYLITKQDNMPVFDFKNPVSETTKTVFATFSNLLISSEAIYRTTPDPYADETAAGVFGIN